ncbi:MAG: protoglobin domain-containing protein [Planctomycetales bacterium]|nr:protoglobin domain-containing protein [Planctomycetales bacterium]
MPEPDRAETLIEEVRRFVGFTVEDEARLASLRPGVLAESGRIVARFYESLSQHEGARRVLRDADQIERLKLTLARWLEEAFTGPYDARYEESRGRIGTVHVRIGLPQRYMLTAMNVIRVEIHGIVDRVVAGDPGERRTHHDSVNRLLDMDLALMLETYRAGLEEEAVEAYRRILQRTTDYVFAATPEGRITYWNRDGRIFSRSAILERGLGLLTGLMTPESRALFDDAWTGAAKDGRTIENLSTSGVHPTTGESLHALWSLYPELGEGGRVRLVRGMIRDVTDVRRLEARLEERRRLAAVGEMVAGVAHEVRNPLQNVVLGLREARRVAGAVPAASAALDQAREGVGQIERLVSDLLSFSSRFSLSLSTVAAADLAEAAIRECASAFGTRPLPRAALPGEEIRLRADPFRMTQVLKNLIQNAAEATAGGGGVAVAVRPDGAAHVEFVVEDDGPGIPPAIRGRLFEPFVTSKKGGTGLGLAIARRLVEAHGGEIRFETRDGGGTRVRVRLPRARTAS